MRYQVTKDIEGKPMEIITYKSINHANALINRYPEKDYYLITKKK